MNTLNIGQQCFLRKATHLIVVTTGKGWDEAQEIALEFFTAANWKISLAGILMHQADLIPNSKFRMW